MLGNIFGQVTILPGLSARVSIGADILNSRRNVFYTPQTLAGSDRNGYGSNGSSSNINLLNENTLTYNKQINDHAFEFLAGVTFQTNSEERAYLETEGFPNYTLGANNRVQAIN
ncbi:hypothetical protein HK413_02185 [Mucilaginibacter sp. S1162]|uniref:TonB-dependent receptor n=1 Tax=Mucilaginibacter humi TaxID=2732510 RepID=A0ABX1VZ94_9SPHI|nr:hypothetical protein [Mucilaginibacter humi]NNU33272.1 hypothetical protein [Mucilaginibacter humi]